MEGGGEGGEEVARGDFYSFIGSGFAGRLRLGEIETETDDSPCDRETRHLAADGGSRPNLQVIAREKRKNNEIRLIVFLPSIFCY